MKLRASQALDLEDDARARLAKSDSKRARAEKKLTKISNSLKGKYPVSFVPLCRTCRKLKIKNEGKRERARPPHRFTLLRCPMAWQPSRRRCSCSKTASLRAQSCRLGVCTLLTGG